MEKESMRRAYRVGGSYWTFLEFKGFSHRDDKRRLHKKLRRYVEIDTISKINEI